MLIRKTLPEDVDTILNIFDTARQYARNREARHNGFTNYPALEDLQARLSEW